MAATSAAVVARSTAERDHIRKRSFDVFLQYLTNSATRSDWWSAVIITAGSKAQSELYRQQIRHRSERGHLPRDVSWHVVPDPEGRHIGSGGATLLALQVLGKYDPVWWARNRVLIIHAGGESRRLPEYSLTGKLFGILPERTPWGENSTVFDETLALSTLWLDRFSSGLAVSSGDVVLTFDAADLDWDRPGVAGAAIRQPLEVGTRHGVYVLDEHGRVYSFLQKPTPPQVRAAGGILPGDEVALDTGLLHFDGGLSSSLSQFASTLPEIPFLDLYKDFTLSLTGEASCALPELATLLRGVPFHCSLVKGTFTHVGTTSHFRRLFKGGVVDSVLAPGSEFSPSTLVIECHLNEPIRAGAGAILHGLTEASGSMLVAEDTVVHQVPVHLPDGRRGFVLRTYGVEDDPKTRNWFGRPIPDPDTVWAGIPESERCLWNARLFPFNNHEEPRLSLATSTEYADTDALAEARDRRRDANWRASAVALARFDTDVRPLLLHAPGINALAETGHTLSAEAVGLEASSPSEAASRHFQASLFYEQAGIAEESARARSAAFAAVQKAVAARPLPGLSTRHSGRTGCVIVSAPARIDFGGGWSDTPPFCLDWGGCVLNLGIELDGAYPTRTTIRRIDDLVVRFRSSEGQLTAECRESAELLRSGAPGDPFSVARTALQMTGIFQPESSLASTLARMGGGLEIHTDVNLPMGSGLGASSILAATTIRALAEMHGASLTNQELSDRTMHLEQLTTTGGGWQDQAGGIFPGAKLLSSGPGLTQRLRVQAISLSPDREAELQDLMVLYYTGIRRIAKGLLQQVVGRYLARETAAIQVLHSIKTLAMEMAYAMQEGEWDYLGELLDRHWGLNQILDPNTTNAPINALLAQTRPYIRGAKLAGAGGGGFMMLLARSPEAAVDLRKLLAERSISEGGSIRHWAIAKEGLHVTQTSFRAAGH